MKCNFLIMMKDSQQCRHSIKPRLDPGLDSGPWTLDSGLWSPESRVQSPESRVQSPESSPGFILCQVRHVFLRDKNIACTYHMRKIDILYL